MIKIKILYNGKVYSDTSKYGYNPTEPSDSNLRKTVMTQSVTVNEGSSTALNFSVSFPENEIILSVTPVCVNGKVLTSVQSISDTVITVNVANMNTAALTIDVTLIVISIPEGSTISILPETTSEEVVLDDIIETATITKWGGVVSIKLGRFIDNYTATGGTLTIGTLPEKYRPIQSQNGMISLRLGSNNVQAFFGVTSSGSVRINIPAGVSLNHEATYGYFVYLTK